MDELYPAAVEEIERMVARMSGLAARLGGTWGISGETHSVPVGLGCWEFRLWKNEQGEWVIGCRNRASGAAGAEQSLGRIPLPAKRAFLRSSERFFSDYESLARREVDGIRKDLSVAWKTVRRLEPARKVGAMAGFPSYRLLEFMS